MSFSSAQIGSITVNRLADGSTDLMVAQPGGTFVSLIGSQESETYDDGYVKSKEYLNQSIKKKKICF